MHRLLAVLVDVRQLALTKDLILTASHIFKKIYIFCLLPASRTNEENHQRVQVTLTVNEDSVYSMYFNFEKSMTGEETNYYPTMRIHSPQFGTLQLLGSVINTPTGVRLDVSFQGETRKFITVDGKWPFLSLLLLPGLIHDYVTACGLEKSYLLLTYKLTWHLAVPVTWPFRKDDTFASSPGWM